MMAVTFFGHRDTWITAELRARLCRAVEREIQNGASVFYFGGYGNFDTMAAGVVQSLKKKYPQIHSVLVLAYLNRKTDMQYYDETVYPPLENTPLRFAISKRNLWMLLHADTVIADVAYSWGGAAQMLQLAKKKNKRVINLAENEREAARLAF